MTFRCAIWLLLLAICHAPPAQAQDAPPAPAGVRWGLVLVGLPGDAEHELSFRELGAAYARWFTESLGCEASRLLLVGMDAEPDAPLGATQEQLAAAVQTLAAQIQPQDALWVATIGHANYDGEHAWLHLRGPDVRDVEWAEMFAPIECQEQVFWLTHTCSGWFLAPLSRPGRVVITATEADQEVNETEFPHALLTAAAREMSSLDSNGDGRVSVAELLLATVAEVNARFAANNRVATEHAQLDDNGDGRGQEAEKLSAAGPPAAQGALPDGKLASDTPLIYNQTNPPTAVEPAPSDISP